MLSIIRTEILRPTNALNQIKRFRGKINIQRPKPPHFEKAKMIALTQQYFKKKERKPLYESCEKDVKYSNKDTEEENPYQRILANELLGNFNGAKMIIFFHKNPISGDDEVMARVLFKKQDMLLKGCGKKTLEMAVKGTKFENILDFYVSHNMILFSPQVEIKKVLNINKKYPALILLAAIVEGKFLNRDDLMKYAAIPNLITAQSEFVQTLNNVGGHLASQLNARSNIMVSQLQERIKQLEEEKK
ncbi:large ribosomal subunit protein uL10m [Onthophagus taurus]|uniref:large ribosomal subunit protein uL10m n=1 Tax=Onthophagus taurus TaxID=166361 RepID=UPI000C20081B|nr:39S ribosomal protein L10, mitochondrial [Onthophagus taurus]